MRISAASTQDVQYVANHMREADREEFSAYLWAKDQAEMVTDLVRRYGGVPAVLCATLNGIPVAIGGCIEARPGVATLFMFATPEFKRIGLSLTRFVKNGLIADMKAQGVHRIECMSIASHNEAHRWIELLGLNEEAPLIRGYGKNGESFKQFSWVAPQYR